MSRQAGAHAVAAGIVSLVALACNSAADSMDAPTAVQAPVSSVPSGSAQPVPTAVPDAPEQVSAEPQPSPTWRDDVWLTAAPMPRARSGFDAVVLGDGSVLAVGNDLDCAPGGASPESELVDVYDPSVDVWREAQPLNRPRKHAATVILPDGSAMVIGGVNTDDIPFSSTKVFSPESGSWRDGPLLTFARSWPAAATLSTGQVLVIGAVTDESPNNATAELLDPDGEAWIQTASSPTDWIPRDVIALADGRALVTGINVVDTEATPIAYVYDAMADRWTPADSPSAPSMPILLTSADATGVALGGNDGGELAGGDGGTVGTVERFDVDTSTWSALSNLSTTRIEAQATALSDGRLVVAGGRSYEGFEDFDDPTTVLGSAATYDPVTDSWSPLPDLGVPRWGGHALQLRDGTVLVLGGSASVHDAVCGDAEIAVERIVVN